MEQITAKERPILIDNKPYRINSSQITGEEIRELCAGIPTNYLLYLKGKDTDKIIDLDTIIKVPPTGILAFYSSPPTTQG